MNWLKSSLNEFLALKESVVRFKDVYIPTSLVEFFDEKHPLDPLTSFGFDRASDRIYEKHGRAFLNGRTFEIKKKR
jgi:hypothetical protein